MIPPLDYRWDGEALVPLRPALCDRHLVVGELYCLVEHHDRSMNSHRHYFAIINEMHRSLPDNLLPEYPTPEHLRKKMLVKCGYAAERSIVCINKAAARRLAAFVQPMDDYAVILTEANVVRVYTAMSQSLKAMGKKDFQESKDKVIAAIEDLLGVERGAAEEAA